MLLEQHGIAWHMSMTSLHATCWTHRDATYSVRGYHVTTSCKNLPPSVPHDKLGTNQTWYLNTVVIQDHQELDLYPRSSYNTICQIRYSWYHSDPLVITINQHRYPQYHGDPPTITYRSTTSFSSGLLLARLLFCWPIVCPITNCAHIRGRGYR